MNNEQLYTQFFSIAKQLNEQFKIAPLLYGSLGLELTASKPLLTHSDIDVLIPTKLLYEQWDEFLAALEQMGYSLIDKREHEFKKETTSVSFAQLEELEQFVGIHEKDIETKMINGIKFMLLSVKQYELVYKKSILDGYRIHTRNKKDQQKIDLIESLITEQASQ